MTQGFCKTCNCMCDLVADDYPDPDWIGEMILFYNCTGCATFVRGTILTATSFGWSERLWRWS